MFRKAARYARTTAKTIRNWQGEGDLLERAIAARDPRLSLSYMQLIEVAVVAAFRRSGVKLDEIKAVRDWLATTFKSEYPFAQFEFKRRGNQSWSIMPRSTRREEKESFWLLGKGGQMVWEEIVGGLLQDFEYEKEIALRWHVAGKGEPIIIDPRISFGAPNVRGVPTWVVRGRWEAGESVPEIADDFDLSQNLVADALKFEGIDAAGQKGDEFTNILFRYLFWQTLSGGNLESAAAIRRRISWEQRK